MTRLTTRGERLRLFASNALHCDSVFGNGCKVSNHRGDEPPAASALTSPPAG